MALGKTPIIKDNELIIEPNEWFVPIKNEYPALERKYAGLELDKTPMNKAKTEALASIRTQWLPRTDLPPRGINFESEGANLKTASTLQALSFFNGSAS